MNFFDLASRADVSLTLARGIILELLEEGEILTIEV